MASKPVLLSEEGRSSLKGLLHEFYERGLQGWRKKRPRKDEEGEYG